jgi:hypothetical protein
VQLIIITKLSWLEHTLYKLERAWSGGVIWKNPKFIMHLLCSLFVFCAAFYSCNSVLKIFFVEVRLWSNPDTVFPLGEGWRSARSLLFLKVSSSQLLSVVLNVVVARRPCSARWFPPLYFPFRSSRPSTPSIVTWCVPHNMHQRGES